MPDVDEAQVSEPQAAAPPPPAAEQAPAPAPTEAAPAAAEQAQAGPAGPSPYGGMFDGEHGDGGNASATPPSAPSDPNDATRHADDAAKQTEQKQDAAQQQVEEAKSQEQAARSAEGPQAETAQKAAEAQTDQAEQQRDAVDAQAQEQDKAQAQTEEQAAKQNGLPTEEDHQAAAQDAAEQQSAQENEAREQASDDKADEKESAETHDDQQQAADEHLEDSDGKADDKADDHSDSDDDRGEGRGRARAPHDICAIPEEYTRPTGMDAVQAVYDRYHDDDPNKQASKNIGNSYNKSGMPPEQDPNAEVKLDTPEAREAALNKMVQNDGTAVGEDKCGPTAVLAGAMRAGGNDGLKAIAGDVAKGPDGKVDPDVKGIQDKLESGGNVSPGDLELLKEKMYDKMRQGESDEEAKKSGVSTDEIRKFINNDSDLRDMYKKSGQEIDYVDNTGSGKGNHFVLGVRKNGDLNEVYDPYMKADGNQVITDHNQVEDYGKARKDVITAR
jgi:hypothetical protein